ncbi:MAG TPA: hypothetical protein VFN35_09120, partial [Ktedonobacteraceae bacterium]|nr:hypothetical protein [Ktedonobacteraceae bacterium]
GLALSLQLLEASEEHLTDQAVEDLFEAHLRTNYSYFGSIDKTLSGFFVLSDEDGNYTLADMRDPHGGIYWQDHETREISLLFETLEDFVAYQQALAAEEEDGRDRWQIREQYAPRQTFRPDLHPSTPGLARRYQWLVWLLGQINRFQNDADMVSHGSGYFLHYWQTPASALSTFQKELPLLPKDPHLAIYWLLHHTCTADEKHFLQTLQACQDIDIPLCQAFVDRLKRFSLHDTFEALPSFRIRRSNFLLSLFHQAEGNNFVPLLQAFLMDETNGLLKAFWLWEQTQKHQQFEELRSALREKPLEHVGIAYLLAQLDQHDGQRTSAFADLYCQQLLRLPSLDDTCLITLHQVYSLIEDFAALAQAVEHFLQDDPYLRRALEMGYFAYERLSQPERVQEVAQQIRALEEIADLLSALQNSKEQLPALQRVGELPLYQRHLLARRILTRPDMYQREAVRAMLLLLLPLEDQAKGQLLIAGMMRLVSSEREPLFAQLTLRLEEDFETTFALLRTFLLAEEPSEKDFLAEMSSKDIKDEILHLLTPYAHQPRVFDFLMEILDRNDCVILRKEVLGKLFIGYSNNVVLPRINVEQARHLLERCIRDAHKGSAVHHEANRVIFYLKYPAVEERLIEALQNETEEEIKGNLYSAIRNTPTPRARAALVERLLHETSSYWRMANALHEIFDAAVHQQALALIEQIKSVRAANNYTATLVEHIEQGSPMVDLVDLVLSWSSVADD